MHSVGPFNLVKNPQNAQMDAFPGMGITGLVATVLLLLLGNYNIGRNLRILPRPGPGKRQWQFCFRGIHIRMTHWMLSTFVGLMRLSNLTWVPIYPSPQ